MDADGRSEMGGCGREEGGEERRRGARGRRRNRATQNKGGREGKARDR